MANNHQILGVILAGGQGRRMGGKNKAELCLSGHRLVDLVVERLGPQVDQVIFNAPSSLDLDIPHAPDLPGDIRGPLAGLLAAFHWGRKNLEKPFSVLTVAVDSPFFPTNLAARLSAVSGPAIAATEGEAQTTFGYWPVKVEPDLKDYIENTENPSIRGFARERKTPLVDFENPKQFFNINTPEDLAKANKLFQ